MPYSYHKQGDKYVVTKKDTGKVVGHTKGTKEALNKYLAALHINANENKTMKKSELTKMIQEVIKEVINEYSVYQGDVSQIKPNPTPKEGEMYLKDLKPGNKFSPISSDLEYIVVKPEQGNSGVEVKYADGTGNMKFRGNVLVKKPKINEAYVPNNIKEFAKRKGASSLVNKVAGWAEKCGKGIRGGTAIGKDYSTLVLDLGYQDGAIRINLDDQTVELYGEEVFDVKSFKMALDNNANEIEEAAPAKAKDLGLSDKGYWRFEFPKDKQGKSTRETAIRDIKSTLDKDQKTYPELKIDIMPSPKEDSVAVIKLIGTGAHKVGTKVKKDYRDLAGFKGAVITKYTPKFTSSGIAPKP